jgi:phenylacetate-CoA ligase
MRRTKSTNPLYQKSTYGPAPKIIREITTQAAVRDMTPFMFDRTAECMPRTQLVALQLDRLKKTLERAHAKVPHFCNAFDAARVTPESLKSLDDLRRFPFTLKTDLRDNYPFAMFAVPREQALRVHASSGTTGRPTVVGYTRGDLDLWSDLMARSLACAGARPGDIVHNAYGYGLFTGGLGAHYGAERLGCTVVPVSGGGTERQVSLLRDFGAGILCATPSYALNIAEVADAMGVDLRQLPVHCGVFGAEPWSEARSEPSVLFFERKADAKAVHGSDNLTDAVRENGGSGGRRQSRWLFTWPAALL